MPKRLVLFVLLLVGLTACGGADVAPGSGAEEPALVTDADLDAAAFVGAEELRSLDLRALPLGNVPNRTTGFSARVSAQGSPAVPLDNTSQLAYVQRRGNNTRVVLRETRAEGRGGYRQVLVYNSAREVSSVAVSGDAQLLVFTAEARDGNAEVYALDRDGSRLGGAGRLVRLTNTGADESDVSMSLGGDLIVAIGAQNAFVLRQGLARRHVGPVVAVCAISDLLLMTAGVAGIGTIVERAGWVIDVVRWAGVAFLTWYAVTALLRARRAESLQAATGDTATLGRALRTAFALTWLNPHVYLDTVVLMGGIGSQLAPGDQAWFTAGAASASLLWFCAIGFGAQRLAPLFRRRAVWRCVDLLTGCMMLVIAAGLIRGG